MDNNDIFRRLRYTFDFNDSEVIEIFGAADYEITRQQACSWLKKDDDPGCLNLYDHQLAIFLNGLINTKRGKKDGETPDPEQYLNNNIILRKLKIALNLRDDDILEILWLVDMKISKHELSAFFRKSDHPKFRPCQDQIMRNFLQGLKIKFYDTKKK